MKPFAFIANCVLTWWKKYPGRLCTALWTKIQDWPDPPPAPDDKGDFLTAFPGIEAMQPLQAYIHEKSRRNLAAANRKRFAKQFLEWAHKWKANYQWRAMFWTAYIFPGEPGHVAFWASPVINEWVQHMRSRRFDPSELIHTILQSMLEEFGEELCHPGSLPRSTSPSH